MSEFLVEIGSEPALRFERPHAVLRAPTGAEAGAVFDSADAALRDGQWVAGLLDYEGGVRLGIFDPPIEDPAAASGSYSIGRTHAEIDRRSYDAAIAAIARAIYDGDVYQVNYTVPFAFAIDGDPYALYSDLAARARVPYAAYVRDGAEHVVSISPELFLRFDGGRIATKPMKGTAPLDRLADLSSPKNRAEHVMIVDLLRNDLRRVCTDVRVEAIYDVERYPTFATMTSTISGALAPDVPLAALFGATFPCGSVTGAPKRAAMRQIAQLETRARGAYCGSVGYLSPERQGWWNVAIRTAQIDATTGIGRFDAGGGIVADSDAEDEAREIELKARFFLECSRAVEPLETFAGGDADAREAHLARLRACAAHFGRRFDDERLRARIDALDLPGTLIRVRVDEAGDAHVESHPLESPVEPVPICLSSERVRSTDPMLGWKTTWRPAYDRASAEAASRGCFDALLANELGELTEGARTTLFARIDGRLVTPPINAGLLPGILRLRLLARGEAVERSLTLAALRAAEEIFVGNSARGMLRARLVES
ncbi:MAG: chorismate-binding protein [Candidatus Eremiobacteraeota bacterium]|nr:chorismate-binding protein [Candidatus Eremiobacteraeota bacterium]